MKNIILTIVILGAAAFGFIYLKESKESAPSTNEELNARATTAKVETKDIDFVVTVAGEITPAEQVSVRPEVNGMIEQLPVDVGDKVKEGDLLFSLDDKNIQIEIEQKQTQIDAANLQLEKAKRNFERDRKLFEEKLVSREAFQNTETEFNLAKKQY
jgi:RND family efflux transporter MFP subunit